MVSRETMTKKKLLQYIRQQKTVKDILDKISVGAVELTTNSIDILSLVVETIHETLGGVLGVVHTEEDMFEKHWKLHQYSESDMAYAFTKNLNKNLQVEGFRSVEDEEFERANRALVQKKNGVYLCTKKGLTGKIVKKPKNKEDITIKTGEKIERDKVFEKLEAWGYTHSDWCSSKNTYALRGGIIDIFPALHKHPIRVELEGLTVISMRVFNITTQESIKEIKKTRIYQPLSETKGSVDWDLKDLYNSSVDNILYITSEYSENTTESESRFDLFCEKLSQKTLPAHLMNKKINDYINRDERIFVFNGVKVDRAIEKNINRCDMVFGGNVKCCLLYTSDAADE